MERLRREQALKPVYTMIGSAGLVIAWIELFWRHCLRAHGPRAPRPTYPLYIGTDGES
jgi:hypothetical protein